MTGIRFIGDSFEENTRNINQEIHEDYDLVEKNQTNLIDAIEIEEFEEIIETKAEETKQKISVATKGKRLGNSNAKTRPVVYKGVFYPSVIAAAQAHNCQQRTIRNHLANGGVPKTKTYNRKPVTYKGVTYPSRSACASALGVCRKTLDWHLGKR